MRQVTTHTNTHTHLFCPVDSLPILATLHHMGTKHSLIFTMLSDVCRLPSHPCCGTTYQMLVIVQIHIVSIQVLLYHCCIYASSYCSLSWRILTSDLSSSCCCSWSCGCMCPSQTQPAHSSPSSHRPCVTRYTTHSHPKWSPVCLPWSHPHLYGTISWPQFHDPSEQARFGDPMVRHVS